jgi:hypothetical protein
MNPEPADGNFTFPVTAITPTYPQDKHGAVYTGIPTATGVYAHTGRTITQVGAFAGYTFTAGDWYFLVSGVGTVVPGWYKIASKTSNDVIVLDGLGLGLAANTANTLVGMIHKAGMLTPDGPGSIQERNQTAPAWSMRSLVLRRWWAKWTAAPGAVRTLTIIDVGGTTIDTFICGVDPTIFGRTEAPYLRIASNRGIGAQLANADHPVKIGWGPAST